MAEMSESFVDLSYRGLALGKRIKLTQVRPAAGYLEMPAPMPVGTTIGIATDDGVVLEAVVAAVHEQVGGATTTPGMLVKPRLDEDAARTWWKQRVTVVEEAAAMPQADADGKVTVRKRPGDSAVPELIDDGRNTAVIEVVDDAAAAEPTVYAAPIAAEPSAEASDAAVPRISVEMAAVNPIEDDGKRTMMMPAMDLEALGLDPSATNQMPAITDDDPGASDPGASDPGATDPGTGVGSKSKKKRKKR
jgi:hypothetical protein